MPLVFADAVYTERYMGKPSENSDSYKVNLTQADLMAAVLVTFLFFALQFRLTKMSPLCSEQNSTVTMRAKNFKTVDYLLVHGTADGMFRHDWQFFLFIYFFSHFPSAALAAGVPASGP